ncbi:sulfotransferase family 2 domain-containing protein [Lutibaculum baratangense]|uniref:Sulfotransferase family protein n=1 Tax=Lutibaculum baratangense AMV1 TaxID=631454 RepID=V4RKR4_9HYPH|nr:sulfotransferase family 2 domain-containing protein [Lutibaculum baratangense]ESR23850.1 hypothetical protein N177_2795 [Lutibaculum baratangense AMV1]
MTSTPPFDDPMWQDAAAAARELDIGPIAVPPEFRRVLAKSVGYGQPSEGLLLNKGKMHEVSVARLEGQLDRHAVFANEVFVLFADRDTGTRAEDLHVEPVRQYLQDLHAHRFRGRQTVFLHIPKTAGTSLRNALEPRFVRPLYVVTKQWFERATDHFDAHDLVGGHVDLATVRKARLEDPTIFTLIRDPFQRLVSLVGHARRPEMTPQQLGPKMQMFRTTPLREVLRSEEGIYELFAQADILCGSRKPARAQVRDVCESIHVGLVEQLPLFLARHGHSLRLDGTELGRHNRTASRSLLVPQEEIDAAASEHAAMIAESRIFYRQVQDLVATPPPGRLLTTLTSAVKGVFVRR